MPADTEGIICQRIAAAKARGVTEVWTTVIHDALWQMRNRGKTKAKLRQEIDEALLESIHSGPAIPVTPAFWKEVRARVSESHKRIEAARALGLAGNLLLPKELFTFIEEEILSGRFASPTEVVCEALRVAEVRGEIQRGNAQLARGEVVDGEEAFEQIRKRSRNRRAQAK